RKAVFSDLDQTLTQRFGSPEQIPEALRRQVSAWRALQARHAEVDEERQLCARSFGPARREGRDLAPLKASMQDITTRLRALAEEQQTLEETLLATLGEDPEPAERSPVRPALPPRLTATAP